MVNFAYILKWIKQYIEVIKNWNWKAILVCWITSFTFWVFNSLNADHTATIELPLKITYNADNVVSITPPPDYVHVNVSGNGWNLLSTSFGFGNDPMYVNLSDPITNNFITSKSMLPDVAEKLRDLGINYILEDSVFFDYDTLAEKSIVVVLDTNDIRLKENHRFVSNIYVNPSKVKLIGAASELRKYQDSITLQIDEIDIDEDFNENITVKYPKSDFVVTNQETVNVRFQVALYLRRTLGVGVQLRNFPEDSLISISPQEAYINFYVREDNNQQYYDSIHVILDYNELNLEDSTICPKLEVPTEFLEPMVEPSFFKVNIEK